MAGASNGYRAAPVTRRLTPGLISSLPGTAGSLLFIFFSTSYPELDSGRLPSEPPIAGYSTCTCLISGNASSFDFPQGLTRWR